MDCLVAYGDTSSENSDEEFDVKIKVVAHNEETNKSQNDVPCNKRSLPYDNFGNDNDEPPIKKVTEDKQVTNNSREISDLKTAKDQLCLPSAIHSMFNCKNDSSWIDNPEEHNFRVRSFPHVEGNWATHVFIPVEFHAQPEFHISLSRTVVIRHHWIESLVDSLRQKLVSLKSCLADITSVKLFANDEKTRTFICLELSVDDTFFMDYVKAVDKCFAEFKLPAYYENPSFHISIGWCLGDVQDRISEDVLLKAREMLGTFCAANPELSVVYARHICCQSGNKSFLIPLIDTDV